jgi:hypothetical protein
MKKRGKAITAVVQVLPVWPFESLAFGKLRKLYHSNVFGRLVVAQFGQHTTVTESDK